MPEYLVKIEYSTIDTYRVTADDEDAAKLKAMNSYPLANSEEEQESVSVHSCVKVEDD
jgi:hypothetical protein